MSYSLHDSGAREVHASGAQRDPSRGKGRWDLLSPIALARLAKVCELGAVKYAARNWERGDPENPGIPLWRFIDSAIRHIYSYIAGLRKEDHLGQAMWNLMAAIHVEERQQRGLVVRQMDDRLPADHLPADLDGLPGYGDAQRLDGSADADSRSAGGAPERVQSYARTPV